MTTSSIELEEKKKIQNKIDKLRANRF